MNVATRDKRDLSDQIGAVLAKDSENPTKDDLKRGQMAMLTTLYYLAVLPGFVHNPLQ